MLEASGAAREDMRHDDRRPRGHPSIWLESRSGKLQQHIQGMDQSYHKFGSRKAQERSLMVCAHPRCSAE